MNDKLPNFLISLLPVELKLSVKISNKVRFSTGPSCLSPGGHQEAWCFCPSLAGAHFTPRNIIPCQSHPLAALGSFSSQFCLRAQCLGLGLPPLPCTCLGMGWAQVIGSCSAPSEKPSWLLIPITPSPWAPWDSLTPSLQLRESFQNNHNDQRPSHSCLLWLNIPIMFIESFISFKMQFNLKFTLV